jgi:hypothetical protein
MEQSLPRSLHDIILTRLGVIGSTRRIYPLHAPILPSRAPTALLSIPVHLGRPADRPRTPEIGTDRPRRDTPSRIVTAPRDRCRSRLAAPPRRLQLALFRGRLVKIGRCGTAPRGEFIWDHGIDTVGGCAGRVRSFQEEWQRRLGCPDRSRRSDGGPRGCH